MFSGIVEETARVVGIEKDMESMSKKELQALEKKLQKQMNTAAAELNFELAAKVRDQLFELKKKMLE
jgi:excinuclease ABC subunit B